MLTRRLVAAMLGATVAFSTGAQATASCEQSSAGTIPLTPPAVYTIETPAATFYIDDRDMFDLDRDGIEWGIWTYLESNGVRGLQAGGHSVLGGPVPPIPVYCPDPVSVDGPPPVGHVVGWYPECYGPSTYNEIIFPDDPCGSPDNPDTLIY